MQRQTRDNSLSRGNALDLERKTIITRDEATPVRMQDVKAPRNAEEWLHPRRVVLLPKYIITLGKASNRDHQRVENRELLILGP